MKTYLYFYRTLSDLDVILKNPELQNVTITDIRELIVTVIHDSSNEEKQIPRVELDCVPNPNGQEILPSLRERLQAAETLINLILDEGDE